MERYWDGINYSSPSSADKNSSSSLFVSEPSFFNGSHIGGSSFGIFAENASNSTPHTLPHRIRDLSLARAEIAVLGIVLALTTLGNSFVLWVLLRRRKHNAPMHLFMVNLCVADLVVALFQVSHVCAYWLQDWKSSTFLFMQIYNLLMMRTFWCWTSCFECLKNC